MATPKLMPERLRLAAARCIVNATPNWWDVSMTDQAEFNVVMRYEVPGDGAEIGTPEDAAHLLLLIAEALDE